jgi:hypothetical protein
MKHIPLTKQQFAIVDDEDFERVSHGKWYASWCSHTNSYRAARFVVEKGKRHFIYMHREVIGASALELVDHINHDTLDNRRANLRLCNRRQNQANQRMVSTNTSGFKGVSLDKRNNKWRARIRVDGKTRHISMHNEAVCAAASYDAVAVQIFGDFALTNKKLGLL